MRPFLHSDRKETETIAVLVPRCIPGLSCAPPPFSLLSAAVVSAKGIFTKYYFLITETMGLLMSKWMTMTKMT